MWKMYFSISTDDHLMGILCRNKRGSGRASGRVKGTFRFQRLRNASEAWGTRDIQYQTENEKVFWELFSKNFKNAA